MNRCLLDVNVFLALLWPAHEAHGAARAWFAKSGRRAWATSQLTQLGVLRLLTNSAVTHGAVSAASAIEVVNEATRHDGHEFWREDARAITKLKSLATRIRGHRQWTDAVLVLQAAEFGGVLVTFDSGVAELAGKELKDRVLVLKTRAT